MWLDSCTSVVSVAGAVGLKLPLREDRLREIDWTAVLRRMRRPRRVANSAEEGLDDYEDRC